MGNRRRKDASGILSRVQRNLWVGALPTLPLIPLPFELRILFLEMGGIQQRNLCYLRYRRRRVDFSCEAILYQPGQQSAVVKVSMGQEDRINNLGEWKMVPNSSAKIPFLIKPAINQKPGAFDL